MGAADGARAEPSREFKAGSRLRRDRGRRSGETCSRASRRRSSYGWLSLTRRRSGRISPAWAQADRASYLACLDTTPQADGADPVGAAYRFFRSQLESCDNPDDPTDIERIENAVISGLALVSVTAQLVDNAHRIFESLNNTGMRLTQGDLLRNYLFMRLPTRGETVYQSLWLPLQNTLSSQELEQLFWLDLVQRDPAVKQTDIYTAQQARLDKLTTEPEIEAEIVRFARLGDLLKTLLNPVLEPDPVVRLRLERLSAWGTTTVCPRF
jgi:hypothetical protein